MNCSLTHILQKQDSKLGFDFDEIDSSIKNEKDNSNFIYLPKMDWKKYPKLELFILSVYFLIGKKPMAAKSLINYVLNSPQYKEHEKEIGKDRISFKMRNMVNMNQKNIEKKFEKLKNEFPEYYKEIEKKILKELSLLRIYIPFNKETNNNKEESCIDSSIKSSPSLSPSPSPSIQVEPTISCEKTHPQDDVGKPMENYEGNHEYIINEIYENLLEIHSRKELELNKKVNKEKEKKGEVQDIPCDDSNDTESVIKKIRLENISKESTPGNYTPPVLPKEKQTQDNSDISKNKWEFGLNNFGDTALLYFLNSEKIECEISFSLIPSLIFFLEKFITNIFKLKFKEGKIKSLRTKFPISPNENHHFGDWVFKAEINKLIYISNRNIYNEKQINDLVDYLYYVCY